MLGVGYSPFSMMREAAVAPLGEWASCNRKIVGSIPIVACKSVNEQVTEPSAAPQAPHCSPLLLNNEGWVKCRGEFHIYVYLYVI